VQGAAKNGRRYRYYVSRKLIRGEPDNDEQGWRVSAPEIERIVGVTAQQMLADHVAIARSLDESGIEVSQLPSALKSAQTWTKSLSAAGDAAFQLAQLTERIELKRDGVQIALKLPIPSVRGDTHLFLTSFVPVLVKRRGAEMRMVLTDNNVPARLNLALVKAVARAHRWSDDLLSNRVRSIAELAKREGVDRRSMRRLMRLGFLAPTVVEAIAEGRQPPELTARVLTPRVDLPLLWTAQEQALGLV